MQSGCRKFHNNGHCPTRYGDKYEQLFIWHCVCRNRSIMTTDLTGQVALVTGAGSGIGASLCRRLGERGATVVVVDVDDEGAEAVAGEVEGFAVHLDVSQRSAWNATIANVIDRFGRLDLLALNAGVMSRPRGLPIDDDPLPWMEQRYELVRGVNLDGVAFGILAAHAHLEAAGGARIVATASGVGLSPLPSDPTYSMTKHGIIGLVRSMAPALAERGITIGAVCPGGVDTPMVSPDLRATGRELASPDHIAAGLEEVLDMGPDQTGGIWISRHEQELWRYEFAPNNRPSQ